MEPEEPSTRKSIKSRRSCVQVLPVQKEERKKRVACLRPAIALEKRSEDNPNQVLTNEERVAQRMAIIEQFICEMQTKQARLSNQRAIKEMLEKIVREVQEQFTFLQQDRMTILESKMKATEQMRNIVQKRNDSIDNTEEKIAHLNPYQAELRKSHEGMDTYRREIAAKTEAMDKLIEEKQQKIKETILRNANTQDMINALKQRMSQLAPQKAMANFYVNILRMQMMKNALMGYHFHIEEAPAGKLFECVKIKDDNQKRLGAMEMIYFVTSCFYPRMQTLLSKFCYKSPLYEVLLLGNIQEHLTQEFREKTGVNNEAEVKRFEGLRVKNVIVVVGNTTSLLIEFKNKLVEHLQCFNNQVARVHYLNFLQVKDGLEEIQISLQLGQYDITRSIYLLSVKAPPTVEQLQSLADSKRRNKFTETLDSLGERRVFLVLDVPTTVHESEHKAYADAIDFLRRHK